MNWRTPRLDGGIEQRAGVHGVVAVVAERIGDRIRHHDRGGEMDDGVDAMPRDQSRRPASRSPVLADDERHRARHQEAKSGRQIVEHDHAARRHRRARAPCGCRYSRRRPVTRIVMDSRPLDLPKSYRMTVKERVRPCAQAGKVMAVMLNARYMSRQTRHDGRYPVHQDLVARRRDPPHAGADRGAQGAARRALSPGWWRRLLRRWCGCIRRSTR